ncbi:MAG: Gfo/Idh/MocA family oxidoreductase [Sphaerochaetaceae bacterium]|nr:Gfo/Idh/MocA family oxidoreductase [Sphaerochaetaceae bacterium]
MEKIRFAVIGSGWRSLFYLRIAKSLPDLFEIVCVKVRNEEKKVFIEKNYGYKVVMSDEEVFELNPDFCVIAVYKKDLAKVSKIYLEHGMDVLSETPLTLVAEELEDFKLLVDKGRYKFMTAEQYYLYPRFSALLKILNSELIGRRSYLRMGLCHDYHGFSLARSILGFNGIFEPVFARRQEYELRQTFSRFEKFNDLSMKESHREIAYYESKDGRVLLEDFTPESYRSPIRPISFYVEGEKGCCKDFTFYYLDDKNETHIESLKIESHIAHREDVNPLQNEVEVIDRIYFENKCVFENIFPDAILSEDEYAIANVLINMKKFTEGELPSYPFYCSYMDVKNTLLLQKKLGN